MAIYRQGQASMDAQGYVTGYDTKWREQLTLIRPGATIFFLTQPLQAAVITEVISDTSIRAITTGGEVVQQTNYLILLHDSLTVDGLAQDVAETLRYYQSKETEIAEAIEFFKDFDLDGLKDLVNQVKESAQQVATDRAATEQLKNDTQQIKDSALAETQKIKDDAVSETNAIKNEAQSIKDQTQQIKDSAVVEVTSIKSKAESARNGAINAKNKADNAKNYAESAKSAAESARDEAMQWAQQVNPENILHKDQNLNDLTDKAEARKVLQVQAVISNDPAIHSAPGDYNHFTNPQRTYELRIANNGEWRVARNSDNTTSALSIGAGGTGATSDVGARKNLNTPVGGQAIYIIENSNVLGFMTTYAESGYYSSGELVTHQPPEASGWWMFELHVHRKNASGHVEYGSIVATSMNGNKWGIICNDGSWGGWYRIARSDRQLMLLNPDDKSALGDYSIAIGDNDSGLKWDRDGQISAFANSERIFAWTPSEIALYRTLNSWVVESGRFAYVNGVRNGDASSFIAGVVGAGNHVDWRSRACGLMVELNTRGAAANIWKATRWGDQHACASDIVIYENGSPYQRILVGGGEFGFAANGNATAASWISTSDIRLKAQLKEIKTAKEKVKSIKGYTYFKRNNLIEDEYSFYSEEAGVIAQDVQTVLPEAVYKISDSDYLGVSYNGVTALLVNAINEMISDSDRQEELIEKQQEEIEMLKSEINEIRNLISKLSDK